MRAVVKEREGKGFIACTEREKPEPKAGEVLIKVAYAGICGTDLKIRSGDYWSNPPVILGHEYSGTIVELGDGVSGFSVGQRVVSETAQVVCGKCEYCLSGSYLMCKERLSIGYGTDGAFAEYIAVRSEILHEIPANVSMEEAALCEPAAVAVHSVFDYASVKSTDMVVVMGPGTIGLLVALVAQSLGASVLLCGTTQDEFRLNLASRHGISVFNTSRGDLTESVDFLTKGRGADWAFDCSGAAPAVSLALRCLKKQGTLIQVGLTKPEVQMDYGLVAMNELTIRGAFGHRNINWTQALKLMDHKKIKAKPLVTHKFPLEKWEEGFDQAQMLNSVKVLLRP